MIHHLTFRPREGVVSGVVAGRSFRLLTRRDQASSMDLWVWHEAARTGESVAPPQGSIAGSVPAGPAGHKLKVADNAELDIYDYPGEDAPPNHLHRGRAVFIKTSGGGLFLHGSSACFNPRCIVIAQAWDELFNALKTTRRLSLVVEL